MDNQADKKYNRKIIRQKNRLHTLSYLFIINIIFYFSSKYFLVDRALVNIDYILFIPILYLMPPLLGAFVFLMFLLIDLLLSLKGIFFFDVNGIFLSLSQLNNIEIENSNIFFAFAAFSITFILLSYYSSKSFKGKPIPFKTILATTIAFMALDLLNGGNKFFTFSPVVSQNIASSQAANFAYALLHQRTSTDEVIPVSNTVDGRLDPASQEPGHEHVLLILVESWGLGATPEIDALATSRLLTPEIRSKYRVEQGKTAFSGATTSAEMRELCGISGSFTTAEQSSSLDCLPGRYQKAGYATYAYHGFTELFFRRNRWYPLQGFEHLKFGASADDRKCGLVFKGKCDVEILSDIADLMRQRSDEKTFVYFLTLNSHLPNSLELAVGTTASCDTILSSSSCLLQQIHDVFFAKLAEVLLDPSLPPMQVLVVGDHAPPFAGLESRQEFSASHVPFVSLTPR